MSSPRRYLLRMVLFILVIAGLTYWLGDALAGAFFANLALNSVIAGVLLVGILYIFREVWTLGPEVAWIDNFRQHDRAALSGSLPRLLSPMANMLGDKSRGRVTLSPVAMRTLLDGIGTRLDEQRETSRYLIGLLVFLGLLGTFYGLLETVRSVGGVINGLTDGGGDPTKALGDLKAGLAVPLAGMATAFSSSMFGLAGSLILGFLDLQAGQAQNRFFNDLEEWLSSLTRIGATPVADGEIGMPAYVQALLEQTADSLDSLQRTLARTEDGRQQNQAALHLLTQEIARMNDLRRPDGDDQTRQHQRTLEQILTRLGEQGVQGRETMVQEIRAEIRLLARTIAALAEGTTP